jgi:NADH dehydrogenase FAD-containing subunit
MKTIVLVGAGHAHLYCLRSLQNEKNLQANVILISGSRYQYYSGMFSGFTEGIYSIDEIRVDVSELSSRANVTFIEKLVMKVDPHRKKVMCSDGSEYAFDVISFDIGSKTDEISHFCSWLVPIKPNYFFAENVLEFRDSDYPVIVGGGASGVELALSILAWKKKKQLNPRVTLISSSPLLSSFGRFVSAKIEAIAKNKGLQIFTNDEVIDMNEHTLLTKQNRSVPHTNVLWLTGPKADSLFAKSDLPCDNKGFLLVKDTLQNTKYPFIFGAGDCVTMVNYPTLPKNGVYAVRQGPVLWNNLKRFISGESCEKFKPQKRYLAILSTGNHEALFIYGRHFYHGRSAWQIKHWIDKKFINKY